MSSHPPEESGWFVVVFLCALPVALLVVTLLRVFGGY